MKLLATIAVHVKGEAILRRPGLWEKIRKAFGGEPDLRTGRMRAALEAEAVVDAVRDALRSIGVANAVSLVVDDLVVFQDKDGRPDDLGDLFLAFHEHSAAIGAGFGALRLAVEHVEAGLHLVIEVQARTEHAANQAAVRVIVSGRLRDLEPRRGEDADAYRARVEPLTRDRAAIDVARAQFESFVARVDGAIAMAMPEARVETIKAEAQIVRPNRNGAERAPEAPDPAGRHYDPYNAYYPSPMFSVLDTLMWVSIFSMMSHPHVVVVNQSGDTLGNADTPGVENAPDPTPAEAGGDAGDTGADHDGGDGGHHDTSGDLGGDAGGGDAGGFDIGGGDTFDVGGDFGGFD